MSEERKASPPTVAEIRAKLNRYKQFRFHDPGDQVLTVADGDALFTALDAANAALFAAGGIVVDVARERDPVVRLARLEGMLRQIEWAWPEWDNDGVVEQTVCHFCDNTEKDGHTSECPLGALLAVPAPREGVT